MQDERELEVQLEKLMDQWRIQPSEELNFQIYRLIAKLQGMGEKKTVRHTPPRPRQTTP